jgi:hypothetical protein
MYLQWMGFAPYPQCRPRKLAIQTRMAPEDIAARLGFEHIQTEESLTEFYKEHLNKSYDLFEDQDFSRIYNLYLERYKKGE